MNWKRLLRNILRTLGVVVLLLAAIVAGGWWYLHPAMQRTDAIPYGRRGTNTLAIDVLRPEKPNGLGVLLFVSGGWKSGKPGSFRAWIAAPLLRRGYTVIPVYHVSRPEASIMEIVEDMNRGVRFVRHHAKDYGIDPQRLGITGGSAGGHLGLMLATRGGPGNAAAPDPVDRESSVVQAVAVFYPVADFLNLGTSREKPGDGGPPKSYANGFGAGATNIAVWKVTGREMSPIYHVHSNMPPVRIHHGDADTLIPLEQSQWFQTAAQKMGCDVTVKVHPGGDHGWLTMPWDIRQFAIWFDGHLRR